MPEHVKAHYRTLSIDELIAAQPQHHERLWPTAERLVETADRLVLEGRGPAGAYRAKHVAGTVANRRTADVATLGSRVHAVSGF